MIIIHVECKKKSSLCQQQHNELKYLKSAE